MKFGSSGCRSAKQPCFSEYALNALVTLFVEVDSDWNRVGVLIGHARTAGHGPSWYRLPAAVLAAVVLIGTALIGNWLLSRLLGVVLAALAVQFVIDGGRAAFG